MVRAGAAIAAALLFEWALRRVGRRLPLVLTRRFVSAGASHPDPAIHHAVGIAIFPVEVALWLGVAWYVTERLPALHDARDMTVSGVAMAFTMPLFTMGDRGYALRDLVALPAVLAVAWGIVSALTRVVEGRLLGTGASDHAGRETVGMLLRYALMLLVTLVVLQAWGIDVRTLAIAGSVLGVGIGFGLQNLANNFVSGIVISLERPIKPGDYVRVGEFQGTVQRIGARSTEIVTNDRVSILVPNSKLLEQEVVSWTHGSRSGSIRATRPGIRSSGRSASTERTGAGSPRTSQRGRMNGGAATSRREPSHASHADPNASAASGRSSTTTRWHTHPDPVRRRIERSIPNRNQSVPVSGTAVGPAGRGAGFNRGPSASTRPRIDPARRRSGRCRG